MAREKSLLHKILYLTIMILVHVGLVELIEHPLLMLEVQGSNPAPAENTTKYPKALRLRGARRQQRHLT